MALFVRKNEETANKQVITIYKGKRIVAAVYQGAKLIWQYIRSCYGRGYWINDKPWSNTDAWKN